MLRNRLIILLFLLGLCFPILAEAQAIPGVGENMYAQKCGRCHFVYSPGDYSMEEWKTIMKEMGPLSGLNEKEEKTVLVYLEQKASDGQAENLPTSPVLAGYMYTEFFSSPDSINTFDIHYLNLNLSGRLHERVSYRAEFELEHGGGKEDPPFIERAYVDAWFLRNMALRIGAIVTPFNRFDDFHAPLENMLITRPQMSREIGVSAWKDVGINLHGNILLTPKFYLNYDAYIINGLGSGSRLRKSRQYKDNNNAKSLGARVSGVFADKWELGTSYYHGAWDDDGKLDLDMLGFHLLGRLGNLNVHAEYSRSISDNAQSLEQGKATGYFFQASYLINDKFRTSVRYGKLDYLDQGNLLGRSPTDYDKKGIALGLNYYLTQTVVFKLEYDFNFEGKRLADKDNNLLALQAAIRF